MIYHKPKPSCPSVGYEDHKRYRRSWQFSPRPVVTVIRDRDVDAAVAELRGEQEEAEQEVTTPLDSFRCANYVER